MRKEFPRARQDAEYESLFELAVFWLTILSFILRKVAAVCSSFESATACSLRMLYEYVHVLAMCRISWPYSVRVVATRLLIAAAALGSCYVRYGTVLLDLRCVPNSPLVQWSCSCFVLVSCGNRDFRRSVQIKLRTVLVRKLLCRFFSVLVPYDTGIRVVDAQVMFLLMAVTQVGCGVFVPPLRLQA